MSSKKKDMQDEVPPKKPDKKPAEGRKYAQIAPESVKIKAESIGIDDLDDSVAKALSEEVSYRLREILFKCTIYMRQSKCTKLRKAHMDSVFSASDLEYTFGHLTEPKFSLVEEEDIYVLEDNVLDLEEVLDLNEDLEQVQPTITGAIVLPDKPPKATAPDKKPASETETLEDMKSLSLSGKTLPPDKQLKSAASAASKKATNETEPLEALGLRKVTKP